MMDEVDQLDCSSVTARVLLVPAQSVRELLSALQTNYLQ